MVLYGFATATSATRSRSLIGATGVGPKLALAILSVHDPDGLRRACARRRPDALTLVPGVGKRTAERLLVELSARLVGTRRSTVVRDGRRPVAPRAEVRDALAGLGYGPDEVRGRPSPAAVPSPEALGAARDASVRASALERLAGWHATSGRAACACVRADPDRGGVPTRRRCGPATWPSSSGQPRAARSTSRSSSARPASAARPSTTCCSPGRPGWARPRSPGIVAAEMERRAAHHQRPRARAGRRPRGHPHQPRRRRRALHRRDPPPAASGRGGPLPGDGGLPARHRDRQGAVGALDPPRPAALHPGRRHHPHRPDHRAAPRPLRLRRPPRLLRRSTTSCTIVERAAGILGVQLERGGRRRDRPRAAGARPASPTACSSGCATTPRSAPTAPSPPSRRPRRPRRSSRSTSCGLDKIDRAILTALCGTFAGAPVGLTTLAVAIGEEPDTIEDVYEPFLLQQGLLQRTPRGRVATTAAWVHLGLAPPEAHAGSPGLF